MTSQNSTNKISFRNLLRDDLRHKTWMLALSILGSFLTGPILFLYLLSNHRRYLNLEEIDLTALKARDCFQYFCTIQLVGQIIIAFIGALIVGWLGFRYLYNKRMVDLYHSSPVSRGRLFRAFWLNGFLIWFVPFLAFELIVGILAILFIGDLSYLGSLCLLLLRNILFLSLCYLIVYHICLAAVMLSGNVVNAILNTLISGLFFLVCFVLYGATMSTFMDRFYLPESHILNNPVYVLSPLVTPIVMAVHLTAETPFADWAWIPVLGTVLMLINGGAAYCFYLKRPSELAERGLDNKFARILLRAAVSLLGGIGFALFFRAIASYNRTVWMLFGAFFGSALAFCVLNISYHSSFKEIFSHKKQYAAVLVCASAIMLSAAFDLFGYDDYIPRKESITGLSLYCSNFTGDYGYTLRDGKVYITDTSSDPDKNLVFTDQEAIYQLLTAATENTYSGYTLPIKVRVSTKLGSYYRQYDIAYPALQYLAPFVESEEYLNTYYPVRRLQLGLPKSLRLHPADGRDLILHDREQIRMLMEAFYRDFQEHSAIGELFRSCSASSISCVYDNSNGSTYEANDLAIAPWYENSLNLLKEWYPLVTWDLRDAAITNIRFSKELLQEDTQQTSLECLYNYFGYSRDGVPMEPEPKRMESAQSAKKRWLVWDVELSDPEIWSQLYPYVIIGNYRNRVCDDYVLLGKATLANGSTSKCYVQYGKMPLELIRSLARQTQIRSDSDTVDSEVFYEEDYDYEIF